MNDLILFLTEPSFPVWVVMLLIAVSGFIFCDIDSENKATINDLNTNYNIERALRMRAHDRVKQLENRIKRMNRKHQNSKPLERRQDEKH